MWNTTTTSSFVHLHWCILKLIFQMPVKCYSTAQQHKQYSDFNFINLYIGEFYTFTVLRPYLKRKIFTVGSQ